MVNGQDLKAMRLQAGISQGEMASKLGCDRKTVINYEVGATDIRVTRMFIWLKCCKVDVGALVSQVKQIREHDKNNAKAKLQDVISILLITIQLWAPVVVTPIYLTALAIAMIVGMYKNNINIIHISLFLLLLNIIEYIIFSTGLIELIKPETGQLIRGSIMFGVQLLISLLAVLLFVFRVQFSRVISKSNTVSLTLFDGFFHWIFIYTSFIYFIALLEHIAWFYFQSSYFTLVYDNFEGLIYIAWIVSCILLFNMMHFKQKQ
ncbi:hypothetical protein CWB96_03730 [Pseudoalteromonas citrea]|uniref:HTH cro/C1-type domain-containing protein n=1 Tax=Pseudoalteromonas citrea TaxID=43655 RepID=A0A5S3XSU2_9GAMM|nr:helix-turn-helix transcriptional regulator [Pseudoalteromonas citrea]TMP45212.1 hypothetical protein CWB97_05280 [Pseudoalteromonas citrea]TMP61407.1 hypothetical protein CWB96_03730 [Pseudoalteromonas citrea]